jgi:xanthine/CO dehydrogenase XdhC/CoxF family maturation factor
VVQAVEGPEPSLGSLMVLNADTDDVVGNVAGPVVDAKPADRARAQLRTGRTARIVLGGSIDACPEELSVLVHVAAPPPRMLIFGAVDFAAALSRAGAFPGYEVTVCDAVGPERCRPGHRAYRAQVRVVPANACMSPAYRLVWKTAAPSTASGDRAAGAIRPVTASQASAPPRTARRGTPRR